MRGADFMEGTLFTLRSLESFVPADHPPRPVREILNTALKQMDWLFEAMLRQVRARFDCAGEAASGTYVAVSLRGEVAPEV